MIAAAIALLLATGQCRQWDIRYVDGQALRVLTCTFLTEVPDEPPETKPPARKS